MTLTKFDLVAIVIILILIGTSIYRHLKERSNEVIVPQTLGVKGLVERVKEELISVEKGRLQTAQSALFELKDFDLEIKFVVNEKTTQSGKIEYEVVTIGRETSVSTENVQTIKLHMTAIPPEEGEAAPSVIPIQKNEVKHDK